MTKKEVQQRVLQNGKPLGLDMFEWDEKTSTFSSDESGLVLDFNGIYHCTFKTGSYCIFKTGSYCIFKTGSDCIFKTGSDCTFDTGSDCIFKTGADCTFKTGSYCIFKTGSDCIFKTGSDCTFDTGSDCTLNTGAGCVVVRRDIYEVIELKEGTTIKLNGYCIKGFIYLNEDDKVEVECEGKKVKISRKSAKALNLI